LSSKLNLGRDRDPDIKYYVLWYERELCVQGDPVLSVDLGLLGERRVGLEAHAQPDYQSCHLAYQGVISSKVMRELKRFPNS